MVQDDIIHNIAIIAVCVFAIWFTGSLWGLLALFFMREM